jgi:Tfp pilus assembly protein PilX
MTSRLREESGLALVQTLLLVLLMLALGIALVIQVHGQQTQSRQERTRESSFNLAEAALNGQVAQLARAWAGSAASALPSSCDPTSSSSTCPRAAMIANGYSGGDYGSSCATAPSTPAWRTVVRDNASGERYWTTAVASRAAYDANADGSVWVRSTATVQCNLVSLVGLATHNIVPIDFPNNVVSANWFSTGNQGRKVIVDTLGSYAQPPSVRPGPASKPAKLGVRCAGLTTAQCLNYDPSKGQVQPDTATVDAGASTSAVSSNQLQSLERQATNAGTFYAAGTCPNGSTNLSSVNGAPVVIKGGCNVTLSGGSINSASNPGVLIIENGTLSLGGNATFYGMVYMVNQQGSTGAVVSITGTASIQGIVAVDGAGGVSAGSSKTNLIYDPRAASLLRGDSGATLDKSSFRVLPQNTP